MKPPGWSLLCKPENSSQFMSLYPKRILCSLYFVLCMPSSKDWIGLLCDWHVKRGTWKQYTVQIPVWTAQKLWKTTKPLLPSYKCVAVNLGCVHRNQLSVFLCCERTTTYGGWNLVVEYCQKKALLRTSKQKPSEQSSSKAPGRQKLDITSTAENNGEWEKS